MPISRKLYEKLQTINTAFGATITVQFLFALNEYFFNNIRTTDKALLALGIEQFYVPKLPVLTMDATNEQLLTLLNEGKTTKEIIQETGLSQSTAYRRIKKIKEMLTHDNTINAAN